MPASIAAASARTNQVPGERAPAPVAQHRVDRRIAKALQRSGDPGRMMSGRLAGIRVKLAVPSIAFFGDRLG
jgi:hypothetical protein